MNLPKAPANIQEERLGTLAVARGFTEKGQIWRETATGDTGIDGQVEFVNDAGNATGCLIAIQVKSGASYLKDGGDFWIFYPGEKHRFYWERFPIPVFVMLHDSQSGITYWVDARQALRSPEASKVKYIEISKGNRLHSTPPATFFETFGVSQDPVLENLELVKFMISKSNPNPRFPLNYLELFAHGMTNICRSIYFGMDIACSVVEHKLAVSNSEFGWAIGEKEHEFLFGFVRFLLAQHLAEVNFSDCLVDWTERELQPTFIAPLTSRGRELVTVIRGFQEALTNEGRLTRERNVGVAQEDFVRMEFTVSHWERIELVDEFCQAMGRREDAT